MKRLFTSMLTLCLIISFILPSASLTTYAESSEKKSEKKNKSKVEVIDHEISPDEAAYYGMDSLPEARNISAPSCILMDATTGAILYDKNADEMHYPASTTKVMTTLLAIENCNMDDIVEFTEDAVYSIPSDSSTAGVNVGAKLTVENCLYILMLQSANEVANALAEHIAGSVDDFPAMMNKRAKELGCTGTHFANAHGYWEEDHYTTAHDMALIMQQALRYKDFRKIAGTVTYTVEDDSLNDTIYLVNHSKILRQDTEYYYEYAKCSKTGYTDVARHTLVTSAKKSGIQLICMTMEEEKGMDYLDTAALFKWGFKNTKAIKPLSDIKLKSMISASKDLDDKQKEAYMTVDTTFNDDYYLLVPKDFKESSLTIAFKGDEDSKEKRLGYITLSVDGKEIGRTPVNYEGSDILEPDSDEYKDSDDLETAPNSERGPKPSQVFGVIIRVFVAIFLIFAIMTLIRRIIAHNKAQKELEKRKAARAKRRSQNK